MKQVDSTSKHAKSHRVREGSSLRPAVYDSSHKRKVRQMPHAELRRSFASGLRA